MASKKDDLYVAITTGAAEVDGVTYHFNRGQTHIRGDHPLVKACPDFFARTDDAFPTVEQATAAPGEKR